MTDHRVCNKSNRTGATCGAKLLILMEHMISSAVLVGFVLLDLFMSFCPFSFGFRGC